MQLDNFILVLAIGVARVSAAVYLLPFFSRDMLGGMFTKNTLILLIVIGLAPLIMPAIPDAPRMGIAMLIFNEFLIGLTIGIPLAFPFWVAYIIGELIDNQRGATMGDTLNPAVGSEASPLSSFITFFWCAAFLLGGGMLGLMQLLAESYRILAVGQVFVLSREAILSLVGVMQQAVAKGVILAGPAIVSMFLAEVSLGVLSRFAPQLNAFSISLTIKSLIAILVMLVYFGPVLPGELMRLVDFDSSLRLVGS
ncbi:type III secretion system export apparatus subunit SctT [Pseudomonas batumici]|uniref:type III secretion system export apparatus subunit SctT n=1 Tax=Pseudomonas batumici TaxID=226910 RepID=UPI0030D3FD42